MSCHGSLFRMMIDDVQKLKAHDPQVTRQCHPDENVEKGYRRVVYDIHDYTTAMHSRIYTTVKA